MSSGSVPPLLRFYPHTPHSHMSHSDPAYPPASSPYLDSNDRSASGASESTIYNYIEHPTRMGGSMVGPSATSTQGAGSSTNGGGSRDSLAGTSKRPFPFPLGSQERDKRARSCEGGHTGSGTVRGSGIREGNGGSWTQENAVREGEGGGSGSGGDATVVGDGEDLRTTEEADVDSSIGDAEPGEEVLRAEMMSIDESGYISVAELPQPVQVDAISAAAADTPRTHSNAISFSPVRTYTYPANGYVTDPTSTLYPMEPTIRNRDTSPVPRIPTPAALRSSSPLSLPVFSPTSSSDSTPSISTFPNRILSQSGLSPVVRDSRSPSRIPPFRSPSSSGLAHIPSLSMHVLAGLETETQGGPVLSERTRPGPLDLGWLTQQLDEALPSPRALELFTSTASEANSSRAQASHIDHAPISRPGSGSASNERVDRPFRALPLTRRVRSPPPSLGSTRDFTMGVGTSFGSSSADSGIPASAVGHRRLPLPWIDLEQDGMNDSGSSGFAGDTPSRVIGSTSSVMGSNSTSSPLFGSVTTPRLGDSLSLIVDGPSSPPFGGLASPIGLESVASTVQSDEVLTTNSGSDDVISSNENLSVRVEVGAGGEYSASATLGSPSTSGSSASTRTTPSGYTRRPPPLSLDGFPVSPTFSAMSGPASASPSFIVSESPTFPASASPRTSTFDLGVTPPGSALPSFVARMMEVDSPVRESPGGDGLGYTYNIPELVLEPRVENDVSSIGALRHFARDPQADGDSLGASPNEALSDIAVGSYFAESPEPEIRREPIRSSLGALEPLRATEDLSARTLRRFDESNGGTGSTPLFPPPRGDSEVSQQGLSTFSPQGSSAFSTSTTSTAQQLDESNSVWSPRLSDLGSTYSQRLTESGVSYPSRPSASGASLPSFRANVSPGPELNMGSRPGRIVRDMSWSFSDLFRSGHEGSTEALSGSGSEASLRPREYDERMEGDSRGGRAGVRSALTRAVRLAGPARGNESLPRLHLNALPRMSGTETTNGSPEQDEQSHFWGAMNGSTNLSRTPPGAGPSEHDVPSFAEAWLEEGSRAARPLPPRRMSSTRWIDLFSEGTTHRMATHTTSHTTSRPSNRPRIPSTRPISSTDSNLFDSLSGMDWSQDSHTSPVAFVNPPSQRAETRQESPQESLTRYQTFAQSIDELRRSPPAYPHQPPNASPNPWSSSNGGTGLRLPPVIAPSTTVAFSTGLETVRAESTGLSGISSWYSESGNDSRPPWAASRHEPLPMLGEPRLNSRSPSGRNSDTLQLPVQEPVHGPPPPSERHGGWLREWERERDRLSRIAREDYIRSQDTEPPTAIPTLAGPNVPEAHRNISSTHRPLTQLSDTQVQGRMWDEHAARQEPRPWPTMTRSSLVTAGFADDDFSNEWTGNTTNLWGNVPRVPPRRPELLPPRSSDISTPMQLSSEPPTNRVSELPFTESPPSLLQEIIDWTRGDQHDSFSSDVFHSFQRANSQRPLPESNPADFRQASDVLRRSLLDTSRRDSREREGSARTGQTRSASNRRFPGLNETPPQPQQSNTTSQAERSRLSVSRDRWESQYARSQSQLDRMRQLLHSRSNESRERETPRRRLTDLGRISTSQSRRRSFMSALDTEPPSPALPLESSSSPRRTRPSGGPWPRGSELQSTRSSSIRHEDHSSWSPAESPSRSNLAHELLRVASRVESGLLHINRELSALADDNEPSRRFSLQTEPVVPQVTRSNTHDRAHEDISPSRMEWMYERNLDPIERRSPPPTLPPFEFSQLERNSDWPSSRRDYLNRQYEEQEDLVNEPYPYPTGRLTPARDLSSYPRHRHIGRDASPRVRPSYTPDEYSWRVAEPWSNDATPSSVATSMPMRDRLLFRASAPSHGPANASSQSPLHPEPAGVRDDRGGSSTHHSQPLTSFGRLHRRRPSPPAVPRHQPPTSTNLPRPIAQQSTSPSPPRSYASRFSHFLPRRTSGRGVTQSGTNSDDNEEWNHPGSGGRMFFLRPRGRVRTTSGGDFLRDDEFDDSYEGLLRLAARIGDAKPRGTPAEVIQAMPSGHYASCPGAKAETRCPICLDDYTQEDVVSLIKQCSHWFHKECIQQWLGNSRTCPVCRGQADGEAGTGPEAGPSSSVSGNSWM